MKPRDTFASWSNIAEPRDCSLMRFCSAANAVTRDLDWALASALLPVPSSDFSLAIPARALEVELRPSRADQLRGADESQRQYRLLTAGMRVDCLQRQSKELAEFRWVVDAKGTTGPTSWESLWQTMVVQSYTLARSRLCGAVRTRRDSESGTSAVAESALQGGHRVQWLQHDVRSTVAIRGLELKAHLTGRSQRQTLRIAVLSLGTLARIRGCAGKPATHLPMSSPTGTAAHRGRPRTAAVRHC
jgi:hypothetical protein